MDQGNFLTSARQELCQPCFEQRLAGTTIVPLSSPTVVAGPGSVS